MWSEAVNRYLMLVASVVLLAGILAACGDDGDDAATATPAAPAATATPAAEPTPANGGDGDPEAGRQLAGAQCAACHSFDGSPSVGPTWQGLYGHEVTLESGETVVADEEYLRESIVEPNAKIVEGFPAVMPSFATILTEEQITDIIAFIKTLE
jgi:mono/diheme cytochrome c family protein